MGTTPNYAFPYPAGTDSPAGHTEIQALAAAVDTALNTEAGTRAAADATNAATSTSLQSQLNAAGLGRMGSYQDTSGATSATTEVKLGQFTFTAVAGRRYRLSISGPQNNSATTGSPTASLLRARWAVGATVTTAGTALLEVQATDYNGLTEMSSGVVEIAPGTFTAGTVAVGLFFQGVLINSGTSKYGNGSVQPSIVSVEDIGT
jgi:hypothetical protein